MKHFSDFMNMMNFNMQLNGLYETEQLQIKKEKEKNDKDNEALLDNEMDMMDSKPKDNAGIGSSFQ
jgi:hypothetical protein